jgi:hypothetical protein
LHVHSPGSYDVVDPEATAEAWYDSELLVTLWAAQLKAEDEGEPS